MAPEMINGGSIMLIQRRLHWPREGGLKNRLGVFEWSWQRSAHRSRKLELAVSRVSNSLAMP
jgi:hypothetical protein